MLKNADEQRYLPLSVPYTLTVRPKGQEIVSATYRGITISESIEQGNVKAAEVTARQKLAQLLVYEVSKAIDAFMGPPSTVE